MTHELPTCTKIMGNGEPCGQEECTTVHMIKYGHDFDSVSYEAASGRLYGALEAHGDIVTIIRWRIAQRDQQWQALLNGLPDQMADAWGGDRQWLTTGSKVATLVGDWLADLHYDLDEGADRG